MIGKRNAGSVQSFYSYFIKRGRKESWIKEVDGISTTKRFTSKENCCRGEIWTTNTEIIDADGFITKSVPISVPVLVWEGAKEESQIIKVFPLSLDTNFFKWPESIIVRIGDEIDFLVEIFNKRSMLSWNLGRLLGKAGGEYRTDIGKASVRFFDNDYQGPIFRGELRELEEDIYFNWKNTEIKLAEILTPSS